MPLSKIKFVLGVLLSHLFFVCVAVSAVTPTFEAIGCFKDDHMKPRPLPILVANLRPDIDWYNPNATIEECAKRTQNHPLKLKYFAIQFYGECYSGVDAEKTYKLDGPSTECVAGLGKGYANFVYRFVEQATSLPTQSPPPSTPTSKPLVYTSSTREWKQSTTDGVITSPSTQPVTASHVPSTTIISTTILPTNKPTSGHVPGCECLQFQVLSSQSRSVFTIGGMAYCDRNLPTTWYRFTGAAGSRMPNRCVPSRRCGTHAPGWLKGAHPSAKEGAVSRTVCYRWKQNCCHWQNQVQVRNCGGYYVYRLSPTSHCQLRYCGDGQSGLLNIHFK